MKPLMEILFVTLVFTIIYGAPVDDTPIPADEFEIKAVERAEVLPEASALTASNPTKNKVDDEVEKLEGAESAYVPFYGGYPYYPYYKPYYGYPGVYPGYPLVYVR